VRARLTLWHAAALTLTLLVLGVIGYSLLRLRVEARVDGELAAAVDAAIALLRQERAEGEGPQVAAESVVHEALTARQGVAVLDGRGRLLAERPLPGARTAPSALAAGPEGGGLRLTTRFDATGIRLRAGTRRLDDLDQGYVLVVVESMHAVDEGLLGARRAALVVLPLAALLAGAAGWLVAGRTLRPVLSMSRDVRTLGAGDLRRRLQVTNPDDELGHLAQTFNGMLAGLESAFERQRRFVADASHELRTPLTVMRATASMTLHRAERAEGEYREALAVILDEAERSSRMVDDLLLLARADSGQYPVRRRPMDLAELMADCTRLARVLGQEAEVAVREPFAAPPPEAPYEGDEDLLRRMMMNLCENAIAHSPTGGTIAIALARTPKGYEARVSDAGAGVTPGDEERIFERFFRAPGQVGRAGAGLGLSIGRWIAGVHGGDLRLVREAQGSTFVAELPWPR